MGRNDSEEGRREGGDSEEVERRILPAAESLTRVDAPVTGLLLVMRGVLVRALGCCHPFRTSCWSCKRCQRTMARRACLLHAR